MEDNIEDFIMLKTLYAVTFILLISCFITLPNVFGNDTGNIKPFNSNTGFYYTVQTGDTLWDLSQKFYSSEWDWPGLWELNDEIKNPHLIFPGQKLRIFFKGGLSLKNRPIYVGPEPAKVKPVDISVEKIEKITAPQPPIKLSFFYSFMDQVGFIRKQAISPAGKILRSKENSDLISENDIIYVEASENDSLIQGKQYQVYETKKIGRKGVRHSIKGIIQIDKNKKDYLTATVIKTYIDINPNDLIMEFLERDKEFIVKKDNDTIDAKLICNDEDSNIFGEQQVVYMDQGLNSNIETGQIYTIYKNLEKQASAFSKKATISFEPIETGKLIVLHTEDISSTVLIFSSKREIHPEDPVH
ncbi:MAG: LysM peptidoglycan-binding domain-containing protein [Desulfobacteraceae bacterium]|nr:LysM peptidoglycan-binding domain-containing protein [Desulfobacteraceae bacterium]